ncbi:MAG TPA: four helix bundle protein [Candidatus Kryptobacter bacterium]|nr:four helix bundle protein [Candidatus Kryptobacter bacterium]
MGRRIERFEDLEVWKESMRLARDIYGQLRNCRDYSLKDQVQRAGVSIPSNIAEGFERQSNKEYVRFLFIAKGSAGELRTQVYLATDLQIVDRKIGLELIDRCRKVSSMLYNLIQTRRRNF